MTHIEILTIIYLTREPLASAHLAAGKIFNYGIAPYFTRAGALFLCFIIVTIPPTASAVSGRTQESPRAHLTLSTCRGKRSKNPPLHCIP